VCYVVRLSSLSKVKKPLFFFLFHQGGERCVFAVFFAPIPEKGISDLIAHSSIIQVLTVGVPAGIVIMLVDEVNSYTQFWIFSSIENNGRLLNKEIDEESDKI